MALFDKLKEKVGKVVDIDKMSEQVSKTANYIKKEVAKVADPSVREQERLENEKVLQEQKEQKEKELQEQKEQERLKKEQERLEMEKALQEEKEQKRIEKEKAIEAFFASNNFDKELDYIFSVLEKSGATAMNFEKGIEHFISKTETTLEKYEILSAAKKVLFSRAFDGGNCTIAKSVATYYFLQEVVIDNPLTRNMYLAKYHKPAEFVMLSYGVAGHAFNYLRNRLESENYQVLTPDAFKLVIEHSDVLKSHTDTNPFTVDTVREKWANDMYNFPLQMVEWSKLDGMLDNEKYVDEICYLAYTMLCKDNNNGGENVSVAQIADIYMAFLKRIYDDRNNH